MKLAGATTAATAFAGTVGAADEADYETIAAQGQVIRIGQGETFENKLIDLTTGDSVVLLVEGGNSTIRNVGFEGLHRGDGFMISITAPSGDVLIENVYLGDGSTKEGESFVHGPGAVFYHKDASCNMTFRHCNVQGWPNNGFYCSNTASGGSAHFDRCYGKNNGVSTYRVGGGDDEIVDSVAYNDDTDYGPGWGGYTEAHGRPVWVWPGDTVSIENSHFADGPYPHAMVLRGSGTAQMSGGAIEGNVQGDGLERTDVSSSPELSVPDGTPTSAVEAASGGASDSTTSGETDATTDEDDTEGEQLLLVEGDSADVTRYEFAVDGSVEQATTDGATIDSEDELGDGSVRGVVADWKDAFRFEGELSSLTVDGPGRVLVDGEEVDPADYGEELPHELEIDGRGAPTSYEITVDGTIELDADEDPDDEATTISGSTVQSSVTDSTQEFRFSGALTDVTFTDGEAAVFLDGERIDPAAYGDTELLPHALVIDGSGTDDPTSYAVTVNGTIVKADPGEATIDTDDTIADGTVRGVVDTELDAYWFAGELGDFSLCGNAAVDVQYNARDQ
ncbi:hypothetical protein [Natrialba aegyptia]|uniref:Right handed beta helix domain-containing protein n=1 Tax=Natrialba aegyptia DSM 13077 TaxID=1227491 RepID=M0BAK3_9EURY|nr:hypothetical protein [Natrialba aegyptia]ELZ07855.1 hypothetical protein C480_03339 [Natrialba aegyptia DSM 13077]